MKILILFALFLQVGQAHALRVLWWNTGGGNYFEKPAGLNHDNSILEDSLRSIIREKDPDLLVLGEFYDEFISTQLTKDIQKKYPFVKKFNYNSKRALKIAVFSEKQFSSDYQINSLGWSKDENSQNHPKDHYYKRSFQKILLTDNGRSINIVPLHTLMPWLEMKSNDSGLSNLSSHLGFIEVGYEILFSTKNKLGYQAKEFAKILKEEMLHDESRATWVVLGDFNIPASYAGMETEIYKTLRGSLKDAKRIGEYNYSFPFPGTFKSKKFQIDHVVSTEGEDLEYQFLKYPGSDHFPMLLDF